MSNWVSPVAISSSLLPPPPARVSDAESSNASDDQEEAAEFDLLKAPVLEIQEPAGQAQEESINQYEEGEEEDGFNTPTSLEHRIPVMTHCPGAPRRALVRRKRKSSSSPSSRPYKGRHNNYLDLSEEVESLFPTQLLDDLCRKMKKARRGLKVDVDDR